MLIGKLIRAVSGIKAALVLNDQGYIVESACLLRIVSDFCSEIMAIGTALQSQESSLPKAVHTFVKQYFTPKDRTPKAFADKRAKADKNADRYVTREALLKARLHQLSQKASRPMDFADNRRFLDMRYDAFVHGSYDTTMQLYDVDTEKFRVGGHPDKSLRNDYEIAICVKLHEVVVAAECTAALTSHARVFEAAREARHLMDSSEPWKPTN